LFEASGQLFLNVGLGGIAERAGESGAVEVGSAGRVGGSFVAAGGANAVQSGFQISTQSI
jgi:hypothetical protein